MIGKFEYQRGSRQGRTSEGTRIELRLINTTENKGSILGESGNSTHRVQSDVDHEPSHATSQPQFLRVGQWPAKIAPAFATPCIALETHSGICRTGTDLQNDEESIGIVHSRTCLNDRTHSEYGHESGELPQPHSTSSAEDLETIEDRGLDLSSDYYQFEWFWILIGMVLLMVSSVPLYVFALNTDAVSLFLPILTSAAIGLCSSLLYTGIFVVLMEYHEAIERFFDRYARLRPRLQRICLRICAYAYACGVLAAFVYTLYYFTFVMYLTFH